MSGFQTRKDFYALLKLQTKSEEQFEELLGSSKPEINKFLLRVGKINSAQCTQTKYRLKRLKDDLNDSGLPDDVRSLLLSRLNDECVAPATPTDNDDSVSSKVWLNLTQQQKKEKLEELCANRLKELMLRLNIQDEMKSSCKKLQKNKINRIYSENFSWKQKVQIKEGDMDGYHDLLKQVEESINVVDFSPDWIRTNCSEAAAYNRSGAEESASLFWKSVQECVDNII